MAGRKQFVVIDAVDRAMRVFWERGYSSATVQHLVDATGLGRGSLYGTFGDKDGLFAACLQRYAETIAADLVRALTEHHGDPHAAVAALYSAVLQRFSAGQHPPGCLLTQSAGECTVLSPPLREVVARLQREQLAAVRAALESGREQHRLPADADVDQLAAFVVGVAHALAVMHRGGADLATLHGVADTALAALPAAS